MSAVRLRGVRRQFGSVQALDGLDLEVPAGQVYGFLGRNGAGKTTTLRMLMGLLHPDSGTIELFGQQVRRVDVKLKQRIGYVAQEQSFYAWMTATQLGAFVGRFYPTWDAAEFKRLLRVLDVPSERRAHQMSGGTRVKLGLALALGHRPELMLLDEPTAGLDPVARAEFNDLLQARVRESGITALFSSHIVAEVEQLATQIGVIQAGKMRFEGSLGTLLDSVRRMPGAAAPGAEAVLPPGFERLRGPVLRGEPGLWDALGGGERLSLEEIFLAFARTDAVVPA